MEQWNGEVRIPINEYNALIDENKRLKQENAELSGVLSELESDKEQKVIVRIERYGGCGKKTSTTTQVQGFKDVREQVEDVYKQSVEFLSKERTRLINELTELQTRSLWQRILNK